MPERAVHALEVELLSDPPAVRLEVRQRAGPLLEVIAVLLSYRAPLRVEIERDGPEVEDPDLLPELRVEPLAKHLLVPLLALQDEMNHLPHGVHAGVGAAASHARDGLARDLGERRLEDLLSRRS